MCRNPSEGQEYIYLEIGEQRRFEGGFLPAARYEVWRRRYVTLFDSFRGGWRIALLVVFSLWKERVVGRAVPWSCLETRPYGLSAPKAALAIGSGTYNSIEMGK